MKPLDISKMAANPPTRMGVAQLTRLAFEGKDLGEIWNRLIETVRRQPANAAPVMDLSVLAQLMGDQKAGAALQQGALQVQRLYRSQTAIGSLRITVLALAGVSDIGANIPLEFLLSGSDVELITLYVSPEASLPNPLPAHDVAIVALGYADGMVDTLEQIEEIAGRWPRPLLNPPDRIFKLQRDEFYALANGLPGIRIPKTVRVSRQTLSQIGNSNIAPDCLLPGARFPLIVRPVDSHAGRGLEKLDTVDAIAAYLDQTIEAEFFLSPFVDYRDGDGLYRKYRVVFIDGKSFACHMAIAPEWKVWYLNAGMDQSEDKRAEEAHFFATFDENFAVRHAAAFEALMRTVGLDYFGIDCAETAEGELLLFEGETAMIVHDMDPPDVYPYKPAQMRKVFSAFTAMLHRHAQSDRAQAA
ncbi:MAG TPA: hypothetical protein VGM17_11015 [Rhizomicrobium sp.]|jgi:hypothetical protein